MKSEGVMGIAKFVASCWASVGGVGTLEHVAGAPSEGGLWRRVPLTREVGADSGWLVSELHCGSVLKGWNSSSPERMVESETIFCLVTAPQDDATWSQASSRIKQWLKFWSWIYSCKKPTGMFTWCHWIDSFWSQTSYSGWYGMQVSRSELTTA